MNNSVILQVDESTKGLMEEIQSGIATSIEDGMREVKDKVESVDGNTDRILSKFKNFEGLTSTIEQLRSLAEESKKFTTIVSPLESSVSELKQGNKSQEQALSQVSSNIDLLVKGIVELGERQYNLNSDIKSEVKNVLSNIEKGNDNTKNLLNNVLQKMSQADNVCLEISNKINSSLSNIKDSISELERCFEDKSTELKGEIHRLTEFQIEFSKRYAENESAHQMFENKSSSQIEEINKSLEKVQATMDIIVNLVTPFWKKWK